MCVFWGFFFRFFFKNCSRCYKSQRAHLSLSYALGYDIKSLGSLAEAQHLFIILMVSIRKAAGYSGKLIERSALKSGGSVLLIGRFLFVEVLYLS